MIPGINPRDMQKAMKKLGISQQEIAAKEVIIKLSDKEIIIKNPSVAKVNMMGQENFQISGEITERQLEVNITEEDIKTVMEQTGKTHEEVSNALKKNKGDLAVTILELQ